MANCPRCGIDHVADDQRETVPVLKLIGFPLYADELTPAQLDVLRPFNEALAAVKQLEGSDVISSRTLSAAHRDLLKSMTTKKFEELIVNTLSIEQSRNVVLRMTKLLIASERLHALKKDLSGSLFSAYGSSSLSDPLGMILESIFGSKDSDAGPATFSVLEVPLPFFGMDRSDESNESNPRRTPDDESTKSTPRIKPHDEPKSPFITRFEQEINPEGFPLGRHGRRDVL
jgi:hypothetical protein